MKTLRFIFSRSTWTVDRIAIAIAIITLLSIISAVLWGVNGLLRDPGVPLG